MKWEEKLSRKNQLPLNILSINKEDIAVNHNKKYFPALIHLDIFLRFSLSKIYFYYDDYDFSIFPEWSSRTFFDDPSIIAVVITDNCDDTWKFFITIPIKKVNLLSAWTSCEIHLKNHYLYHQIISGWLTNKSVCFSIFYWLGMSNANVMLCHFYSVQNWEFSRKFEKLIFVQLTVEKWTVGKSTNSEICQNKTTSHESRSCTYGVINTTKLNVQYISVEWNVITI